MNYLALTDLCLRLEEDQRADLLRFLHERAIYTVGQWRLIAHPEDVVGKRGVRIIEGAIRREERRRRRRQQKLFGAWLCVRMN